MFLFLTVVQALIAAALVGVILIQRSEGGGLGVGGSPSGIMSARGAADFLTRTTAILAVLFVLLSIVLAALAVNVTSGRNAPASRSAGGRCWRRGRRRGGRAGSRGPRSAGGPARRCCTLTGGGSRL
jgi:preprotein translocase subunit SecG